MKHINYYSASTEAVEDSFDAFLVENADFTTLGEEYPIIPETMIAKSLPDKILPFEKAISSREDLSKTFICFYSKDKTFERIRRTPANYVNFFRKTAGIIGPDFSIHTDMPVIKQKSQINDNLSLTYYYGSKGIPVIPNLRCGINELIPELFEAIPKNCIVAIGTHGFVKYYEQQYEWYCFLEKILEQLNPSHVVVYGTLRGTILKSFKDDPRFVLYEPWLDSHRRGNRHAN